MSLALKFSIIFLLVFGIGAAATAYICRSFLLRNARSTVLEQARLMLETSLAARQYTAKQAGPLIESLDRSGRQFHPETIPFFAATENFNYVHSRHREYSYKEATLNPSNPRDRAADWEADLINVFRNDRRQTELTIERDTPIGRSLVVARPIVTTEECLMCHGSPKAAPPAQIRLYGNVNGFGWKNGEVIGAQIISVPMALPIGLAGDALRSLTVSLVGLGLVMLVLLNLGIHFVVTRRVTTLATLADEVSKGRVEIPEFPVSGRDEVAVLAGAFNRMHRSLRSALKMLEPGSDDRK